MTRGNKHQCYYCGQPESCTKDHFIPASKRGFLTVWACRFCQASKADMMPLEWLKYLKGHVLIDNNKLIRVESSVTSLWEKVMNREIPAAHNLKLMCS